MSQDSRPVAAPGEPALAERLYSDQIKAYAARGDQDASLEPAAWRLLKRNPTCGSQVLFTARPLAGQARLDNPEIELGCDARRACLLTQAATSALVEGLQGLRLEEARAKLASGQQRLQELLASGQAPSDANGTAQDWPQLAMFAPAARVRARHSSIMLPFLTASQALAEITDA